MIAIWEGGIAIYGAVIAGGITAFVLAKIKKQSVLKVFDAMVPGLLLAQAIGRWGNFVNGEAYGETMTKVLPWGMVVNGVGPVHPTFLYESLITLTGFLLAMFLIYPKKKWNGQVFCFYLVWYGIGRVMVEGLRTDSLMIGPFRLAQCIGLLSALGGVALFVLLFRKHLDGASATQAEAVTLSENGEEPSEPAKEEKNEPACAEMKPVEETACEEAETVEEPISTESDIAEEKKDEKKENEDGTDH
jgi:phosphatidylglycerol:prolipoprotein diacylglycerol transferase